MSDDALPEWTPEGEEEQLRRIRELEKLAETMNRQHENVRWLLDGDRRNRDADLYKGQVVIYNLETGENVGHVGDHSKLSAAIQSAGLKPTEVHVEYY